jgi:hypothetical protein
MRYRLYVAQRIESEAVVELVLNLERAMGIEPTSEAWEAHDITQEHAGLAAFFAILGTP